MPDMGDLSLPHGLWLAAYVAMLAAACWTDVSRAKIPNALTFSGMGLGLAFASLPSGIGPGWAALGLVVGGAVPMLLHRLGVLGGGDVKLFAAIGAFVGLPHVLVVLLFTFAAGGLLAIAAALFARRLRAVLSNVRDGLTQMAGTLLLLRRIPDGRSIPVTAQRVPYALAIAAGALYHLFYMHEALLT
ncbi:MAG: prepilin peptidase [Betaproteobacteria bacterium]